MKKLSNKKGFTLAELLIVVAIIGILTAISVPIFTSQLKKSKLSTNQANARAAHSAVVSAMLDKGFNGASGVYDVKTGNLTSAGVSQISGTTKASGTYATDPQEWKVDDATYKDLTADVMATWTVQIDENGNVAYSCDTGKKGS